MAYKIEITPEMKQQFQSETIEHLNGFENMLMTIEKEPFNREAIDSAFRYIHSIKGNSDYLGVKDINLLAHFLEDIMGDIRSGKIPVGNEALSILFDGLDFLNDMNRRIIDEDYQEMDISDIENRIRDIKRLIQKNASIQNHELETGTDVFSDVLQRDVKVSLNKIDTFLSHITELTVFKNNLNHISQSSGVEAPDSGWFENLKRIASGINRISDSLYWDIMGLRLIKINAIFERLPRIVRDISSQTGKKAELSISGMETEIDRKTAEYLIDPLIHLIRNAVDHGIELPEERERKGKSVSGTISVSAYPEGNFTIIEVTDDGSGIHPRKIKESALKGKLFTEDEINTMTEDEIVSLVFNAGFSTVSQATKFSGRGVGLDVVKNHVEKIGGSVKISSRPDVFTKVVLKFPIVMFVTDVLLTLAEGKQYAFPFSSILRMIKIKKKQVHGTKRSHFFLFEGKTLFVKHLCHVLGMDCSGNIREKNSDQEINVIVLKERTQSFGIAVDEILGRESILIKPLQSQLAGIKEFSGSALLGDGSIVLVIDPMEILNQFLR